MSKQIKSKQRVANHGEVFTADREVNAMLDLVKDETLRFDSRFLEPACGDGNFLAEILRRKLTVIQKEYGKSPIDFERIAVRAISSIYGIDLLSDNVVACRKRLFELWNQSYTAICENAANDQTRETVRSILSLNIVCGNALSMMCVDEQQQDTKDPIVFPEWSFPDNNTQMEHRDCRFDALQMKFDVIVGNPPYQLSDGGNSASAVPIYHNFIEQAKKLEPKFLSMIIPARWYMGGRGLTAFRKDMLNDDQIRELHDFPDASDCFPGVEIKGGVCYFLWAKGTHGNCKVYSHHGDDVQMTERPLLEDGMDTFLRNDVQISVLHKVLAQKEPPLTEWLNAGRFFGFHTKVTWDENQETGQIQTADGKSFIPMHSSRQGEQDVKIYVHGGACWLNMDSVPKNRAFLKEYKVLVPRSGNPHGSILGKPKLSEPNSGSSNTYIVVCPPTGHLTKEEALHIMEYLKTRFVRFLIATKTATQDMAPRSYSFVPLQDFTQGWTDEKLYQKYQLTPKEIQTITDTIPPME